MDLVLITQIWIKGEPWIAWGSSTGVNWVTNTNWFSISRRHRLLLLTFKHRKLQVYYNNGSQTNHHPGEIFALVVLRTSSRSVSNSVSLSYVAVCACECVWVCVCTRGNMERRENIVCVCVWVGGSICINVHISICAWISVCVWALLCKICA